MPPLETEFLSSTHTVLHDSVTEVFVTEVIPEKEVEYRQWLAKIHQVESRFPGFKGIYVGPPSQGKKNWITLLQFDSVAHLDQWLTSAERKQVLEESKELVNSLESHRLISPYACWFKSVEPNPALLPAVWKQAMIVLLVLFPIVMLEFKLVNPRLTGLNISLATFIGNAISVSLVTWPMVPLAIAFLHWWLLPEGKEALSKTILGCFVVIGLYLIEILVFWSFV